MAYDLWTKKTSSRNWAIGCNDAGVFVAGDFTPVSRPAQPGFHRRHRRHSHHHANDSYNPYLYSPYQQPALPARPVPQPTIDVFVGYALSAGVPVRKVQSVLASKGYGPRQIAAVVGRVSRRLLNQR